jgi:hypothetical protein
MTQPTHTDWIQVSLSLACVLVGYYVLTRKKRQ